MTLAWFVGNVGAGNGCAGTTGRWQAKERHGCCRWVQGQGGDPELL